MRSIRHSVLLILLLWPVAGAADNFIAVGSSPGPIHSSTVSTSYASDVLYTVKNSDLTLPDTLTFTFTVSSIQPSVSLQSVTHSRPGSSGVVIMNLAPGEERSGYLGDLRTIVYGGPGASQGPYSVETEYQLTVHSQLTGQTSTYRFRQTVFGTLSTSGTVGLQSLPDFEFSYNNAAPTEFVWVRLKMTNAQAEPRSVYLYANVDGDLSLFFSHSVAAGSANDPEVETVYQGAVIPSDSGVAVATGGPILVSGSEQWIRLQDGNEWALEYLWPDGDPELIRTRLNVDVFSDDPLELVVADPYGNEIDRIVMQPGKYSASVDVEFTGWNGQELSFTLAGENASSYGIDVSGSPLVAGGLNRLDLQVSRSDDTLTEVSRTTTTTTGPDGQPVEAVQRIIEDGSGGQLVTVEIPNRPFNPSQNFSGSYGPAGQTASDQIAAYLAALEAIGAMQETGEDPDLDDAKGEGTGTASAIGDGAAGAVGSLGNIGAVPATQESEWVISIPPINGVTVPAITVPLDHPAVSWVRLLLLICISLLWMSRALHLLKV